MSPNHSTELLNPRAETVFVAVIYATPRSAGRKLSESETLSLCSVCVCTVCVCRNARDVCVCGCGVRTSVLRQFVRLSHLRAKLRASRGEGSRRARTKTFGVLNSSQCLLSENRCGETIPNSRSTPTNSPHWLEKLAA